LLNELNHSILISRSNGFPLPSGSTGIGRESEFHPEQFRKTSEGMTDYGNTAQGIDWQTGPREPYRIQENSRESKTIQCFGECTGDGEQNDQELRFFEPAPIKCHLEEIWAYS
jgi:hypothetical protein